MSPGLANRILVVEDDRSVADSLCADLSVEGFKVRHAGDARSAIRMAESFAPDLIILDVMLPDRSGFDVFGSLRPTGRTAVIFLTACSARSEKLRGLKMGTDDYVTKPFDLQELVARIYAVLRRVYSRRGCLVFGDVVVDLESGTVHRGNETSRLKHREAELLRYLTAHAGSVVDREELLRAIWSYSDHSGRTRAVDHAIARLRRMIEDTPHEPRFIVTVHGDGYLMLPRRKTIRVSASQMRSPAEGVPASLHYITK